MSRGGLRERSGRKPYLGSLERLAVGCKCEGILQDITISKQNMKLRAKLDASDYPTLIARLDAIPVEKRADWLKTEEFFTHLSDVELERHFIAGSNPDHGKADRLIEIAPTRPQGVRAKIITRVSTELSHQLGKRVSESFVRRCWEEFRAMRRRLQTDF